MRPIDADALKERFSNMYRDDYEEWIKSIIDKAPTLPNPCGNPCNFIRPTGDRKCVTCKYCDGEIINKHCRTCSHAWADLYEEAENET